MSYSQSDITSLLGKNKLAISAASSSLYSKIRSGVDTTKIEDQLSKLHLSELYLQNISNPEDVDAYIIQRILKGVNDFVKIVSL